MVTRLVVTFTSAVMFTGNPSDAFQQAGSSLSEVGQQLGDWLARQRGSGNDQ